MWLPASVIPRYRLIFVFSGTDATLLPTPPEVALTELRPCRRCRSRKSLGEEPLDVLENLLRLVPPIEDPYTRRALAAGVRGDDDRHLGTLCAGRVGRAKRPRDRISPVEHGDVEVLIENGLGEPLRRGQLLDLEVTATEEEACKPQEARIAARHEDARAGLVLLVVEGRGASVGPGVRSTA